MQISWQRQINSNDACSPFWLSYLLFHHFWNLFGYTGDKFSDTSISGWGLTTQNTLKAGLDSSNSEDPPLGEQIGDHMERFMMKKQFKPHLLLEARQ